MRKFIKYTIISAIFLLTQIGISALVFLIVHTQLAYIIDSNSTTNTSHGPDLASFFGYILIIGIVLGILTPFISLSIFRLFTKLLSKVNKLFKVDVKRRIVIAVFWSFIISILFLTIPLLKQTISERHYKEFNFQQSDYNKQGISKICVYNTGECYYGDTLGKRLEGIVPLPDPARTIYITDFRVEDILALANESTIIMIVLSAIYVAVNFLVILLIEGVIKLIKKLLRK